MTPSPGSSAAVDSKTIGLLGGSFDPPHMGHVLLAAVGIAGMGLGEVWMLPCRRHPFGKALSSFEDRVRMCRLAVATLGGRVRVEPIEGELGAEDEPSYTIESVEALRERHRDLSFRLLVGSDLMREMETWRDYGRLCRLAPPLAVPRLGHEAALGEEGPHTLPALSSSAVRARVAEGLPLDGWVPHAVAAYIKTKSLYADSLIH